jgi:outer membrane protein OmpA-like peptidoglycan-associated protein
VSRSASRLPRRPLLAATAAIAGLSIAGVTGALPTAATSDGPGTARVVDITAPVVDIVTATSDPEGVVTDQESARQVTLVLDATVLFAKDSATLTRRARSVLADVVRRIEQVGPGAVRIVGYTDDLGSAQHGLVLSRQRAQAVAAALRPRLAAADHPFTVEGRGETDFVAPNTSEANRRKNRRVEVTMSRSG